MKTLASTIVTAALGCWLLAGCNRPPNSPAPNFDPSGMVWIHPVKKADAVPGIDQASVYFMGTVFLVWGDSPDGDGGDPKSHGDGGRDGTECSGHIGFHKGKKVEFHCKTKDGKSGPVTINGSAYNLADGGVFLVSTTGDDVHVKQLKREMRNQKFDQESLAAFGKGDAEIVGYFAKGAKAK